MATVNAMMVTIARELRGLTQQALAEKLQIAQGTLSKIEAGQSSPAADLVDRLATELGFPPAFFAERPQFRRLPPTFYRRRCRVKQSAVRQLEARMNIVRLWLDRLGRSAELPPPRFPLLGLRELGWTAEEAACEVRRRWNLPPGPIRELTALVEAAGIVVIELDLGVDVDGFSVWEPNAGIPPIIFITTSHPGERQRFTLAHELGHLVLHLHLEMHDEPDERDYEDEANKFASELLLPASDVRGHLMNVTLQSLASIKPYWRVSMQAMVSKASTLGLLNESQRLRIWKQISVRGYRSGQPEPNAVPREVPRLFAETIGVHLGELGYSEQDLADLLLSSVSDFQPWLPRPPGGLRVVR